MISKPAVLTALGLWALGCTAAWAGSAEFSATMIIKRGARSGQARIMYKKDRFRIDIVGKKGKRRMIIRRDIGAIWFVDLADRKYREVKTKKLAGALALAKRLPGEKERRLLAEEKVSGLSTKKYLVIFERRGREARVYQWVAPSLGVPVKIHYLKRKLGWQLRDIKVAPQPDRLFELPPGLRKMEGK